MTDDLEQAELFDALTAGLLRISMTRWPCASSPI
jgi:hypothetical protein